MPDERDEARSLYLKALDDRSRLEPFAYWTHNELVKGFSDAEIFDALQYLETKGFIEARHSIGDQGFSPARITAYGQDFLSNTAAYRSDRTLGSFANATINLNTTNIHGSIVGNLASGGTDNAFSGSITIINHPQADALRDAFQAFDTALAKDTVLDGDEKDEIAQHVEVVRQELAKPTDKQDGKKIARRWERVTALIAVAAPLLEIGLTISRYLSAGHGA